LGSLCLAKLEADARKKGIDNLIADISSENTGSVAFHKKHGFSIAGELLNVGRKHNKSFGIVYMQKQL
jgi:phosphinothricin acetyltransferase